MAHSLNTREHQALQKTLEVAVRRGVITEYQARLVEQAGPDNLDAIERRQLCDIAKSLAEQSDPFGYQNSSARFEQVLPRHSEATLRKDNQYSRNAMLSVLEKGMMAGAIRPAELVAFDIGGIDALSPEARFVCAEMAKALAEEPDDTDDLFETRTVEDWSQVKSDGELMSRTGSKPTDWQRAVKAVEELVTARLISPMEYEHFRTYGKFDPMTAERITGFLQVNSALSTKALSLIRDMLAGEGRAKR